MTPSSFQQSSLSLIYGDPLWKSDRVKFLGTLTEKIDNYSQSLSANVGYDKASFSFVGGLNELEDWFESGIGRHIEIYNSELVLIWEGFVNNITLSIGSFGISRGGLLEITNKANVVYSTIDNTVSPPIFGARTKTAAAQDTDSQSKYSILESIVSVGGTEATEAEQVRDTYLEENKDPQTSQNINIGDSKGPSLTIDCLGYYHFLSKYIYTDSTTSTTINLSAKIEAILGADPNSIFSTNYDKIDENTLQVEEQDNSDRTAQAIIKGLVGIGDTSNNRYTFGVYKNRQIVYSVVPTTIMYFSRLSDNAQRIYLKDTSEIVNPWDVLPAQWVFITDFLVGRTQPSSLRLDPRMVFIESVNFSTPNKLSINGSKTGKLQQIMAKIQGTGGI